MPIFRPRLQGDPAFLTMTQIRDLAFHFGVDMDLALKLGADPDPASNNVRGSTRFRIRNAAI
jgi:hypothetical protein